METIAVLGLLVR